MANSCESPCIEVLCSNVKKCCSFGVQIDLALKNNRLTSWEKSEEKCAERSVVSWRNRVKLEKKGSNWRNRVKLEKRGSN